MRPAKQFKRSTRLKAVHPVDFVLRTKLNDGVRPGKCKLPIQSYTFYTCCAYCDRRVNLLFRFLSACHPQIVFALLATVLLLPELLLYFNEHCGVNQVRVQSTAQSRHLEIYQGVDSSCISEMWQRFCRLHGALH